MGWWFRIRFWQRVLLGFGLGALAGWGLGERAAEWFQPLGDLYISLIKMIATPLVFCAVLHSVASLHGMRRVAALGGRTLLWFVLTAVLAVGVGLGVATWIQPGLGLGQLTMAAGYQVSQVPTPVQVLLDVVPSNPFRALADGKILQVIFFAALLGAALVRLGERGERLRQGVDEANQAMIQVTRYVLEFTPLGTFGLIAALVGGYGFAQLLPLGKFVLAMYLACSVQVVLVYGGLLLLHRLNPWHFFRAVFPAMQVAFSTSSSYAALPVAQRTATHNLGVDADYAAFAVPLGASIKMDGCGAIYPAVSAIFVAGYFGLSLEPSQYFVILLASVLGSFGTAGVPSTAIVMVTLVLSSAGLPVEGIGYLVAIDRVIDMMRTLTNVTGQILVPVLVAREEHCLDLTTYRRAPTNLGLEQESA